MAVPAVARGKELAVLGLATVHHPPRQCRDVTVAIKNHVIQVAQVSPGSPSPIRLVTLSGTPAYNCAPRVCVYYCRTYYKVVRGGGRRRVDDMCYDRRRAEACVD